MKKLWKKIQTFFIGLFAGEKKLEKFLLDNADDAINVFVDIKAAIDNPIVDIAMLATPDYIDNIIIKGRDKAREVLDKVIAKIYKGKGCLELPTFNERFACFIMEVKSNTPKLQGGIVLMGASAYVQEVSDKPLKDSQADTLVINRLAERKIDSGAWTLPNSASA